MTLPLSVGQRLRTEGLVIIAANCQTGPEPTDKLIDTAEGYALYRPVDKR